MEAPFTLKSFWVGSRTCSGSSCTHWWEIFLAEKLHPEDIFLTLEPGNCLGCALSENLDLEAQVPHGLQHGWERILPLLGCPGGFFPNTLITAALLCVLCNTTALCSILLTSG